MIESFGNQKKRERVFQRIYKGKDNMENIIWNHSKIIYSDGIHGLVRGKASFFSFSSTYVTKQSNYPNGNISTSILIIPIKYITIQLYQITSINLFYFPNSSKHFLFLSSSSTILTFTFYFFPVPNKFC